MKKKKKKKKKSAFEQKNCNVTALKKKTVQKTMLVAQKLAYLAK